MVDYLNFPSKLIHVLYIFVLLISVIVTEGLTQLLSKSVFFGPLREYFNSKESKLFKFLSRIVECPYCSSVWTSGFLTLLVFSLGTISLFGNIFLDAFLFLIVCHRLSNHFHDVADRYFSKDYK